MHFNKFIKKYKALPAQVRASFWFLMCSFLQKGISVITTPIFTRLLSTAEYGQFNVFNSWLGIITVIVSMRLYYGAYPPGLVKFESERSAFSSSLQGLTLTVEVIWVIIYLIFHDFWNRIFNLTTVQMLAMLVLIWTTSVYNFWAAEQRVEYKYRTLVILTIIVTLAKPLLGIFLVTHSQDKVTARIIGLVLVELISYTWLFYVQLRKGKAYYSKKFWRYAFLFNLPLIPHYLSQTVLTSSDRIMIQKMIGDSEAGIYGLAYSISQMMSLFNTALSQTIEPWMYKKIKDKRYEELGRVVYPALVMIAVANIMLIAIAPEIVMLFAPSSYYDAIWVIPPVAMSVFLGFMYGMFASIEFYYEKTKFITLATITSAGLNILLNYLFIKIFGYYAAGYTTLVCYIFYVLFHYIVMNRIRVSMLGGVPIYNTKVIIGISAVFMIIGFLFLTTYGVAMARYSLIALIAVASILFRKRIISELKHILGVRNESR